MKKGGGRKEPRPSVADEFDEGAATVRDSVTAAALAARTEAGKAPARTILGTPLPRPAPAQRPPANAGRGENAPVAATPPDDGLTPRPTAATAAGGERAPNARTCPGCGVEVKAGYVRCPRCKRAFEKVKRGGGTALRSRTIPWTIVALCAIATTVILVLANRDPELRTLASFVTDEDEPDAGPEDEAAPEAEAEAEAAPEPATEPAPEPATDDE
jgi:hypothetical protein